MPENIIKVSQTVSPVARNGGGDISEVEMARERQVLQNTPSGRVQPVHPKKQLFSAPVNKFTAKTSRLKTPNTARLRKCLDEFSTPTTVVCSTPKKIGPKAMSMEDLTPSKRIVKDRKLDGLPPLLSPAPSRATAEEEAAARVGRFMLLTAWRRRREEVKCLRKTLEVQVSCSERLRIQVSTLKYLLDSDNTKVRLAMKELDRLKQLLRERDTEKTILEREQKSLEADISAAEDRISEISIAWHNCRNELDGTRAAATSSERMLCLERAACADARAKLDHAYTRLSLMEAEQVQQEALLAAAESELTALHHEALDKHRLLQQTEHQLLIETETKEEYVQDNMSLNARVSIKTEEVNQLKEVVSNLKEELFSLNMELVRTKEQLDWWPKPFTRLMGAARSMLRHPISIPEMLMWSLLPARHGC